MKKTEFGDITMLKVSDLRCIDVFEAKLGAGGKMLPLYGPNGAGKSTIIDSLAILFDGGKLPEDLIRHGKTEALIEAMSSSGIIIRKRIRRKKTDNSQVTELVLTKDNQPIPSPQKALKELFGGLASPNRIAELSGAKLYEEVCRASGVSTDEFDNGIAEQKRKISDFNAELRVLGIVEYPGKVPEYLKDLKPFDHARFEELQDSIESRRESADRKDQVQHSIARGLEIIEGLKKQIVAAEEKIETYRKEFDELVLIVASPEALKEVEEHAKLSDSLRYTEELAVHTKFDKWQDDKKKIDTSIEECKVDVKKSEAARIDYLFHADLGVPGLRLTEDRGVLYNENRWENTCFSDKMKASAILTMKGMDPEQLNLMYMEHGESLSKAKREELANACKVEGVHLIMEVFVENEAHAGDDGIVLHPVAEEPIVPKQPMNEEQVEAFEKEHGIKVLPPNKVDPAPATFGKSIPDHILETPAEENPFDSVDESLFGGINEDLDF